MADSLPAIIGHILECRGIPTEAQELLHKCRAESTFKGKLYKFRAWGKYARESGICTLNFNSPEGVAFIARLALDPKTGGSPAKQAKETFTFVNKFAGPFPGIMQLLVDSAFRISPSRPRRVSTFDITLLLDYLHDMGPCDKLSYHALRDRALALFAIDIMGQRQAPSNLFSIVVEFTYDSSESKLSEDPRHTESVTFRLFRGKLYRPGEKPDWGIPYTVRRAKYRGKFYCSTPENMRFLQERTEDERKFTYDGFFPPITRKNYSKFNNLQPPSVTRILMGLLKASEVDDSYTAGDIRAAVATKCYYQGVSVKAILDRGGWLCESTFFQWYRKISDIIPPRENSDLRVERAVRRRTRTS